MTAAAVRLPIFLLAVLAVAGSVRGQSLTGLTGLVTIPTADMPEDGTLTLGFNYLNRGGLAYHDGLHHAKSPFASLVFLPFLEVGLRLTRADSGVEEALGDRMASVRVRLLSEKALRPALVAGAHDLLGSKRHFHAEYVVASKTVRPAVFLDHVGFHIGYGTRLLDAVLYEFVGLFGGVSIAPVPFARLLVEYDGDTINLGADVRLWKRLHLQFGLSDLRAASGGISYSVLLPQ